MEYELACDSLRDHIASALLELERPTLVAAARAAAATRDLADAIHHAAGRPSDARWGAALTSLESFIDICRLSPRVSRSRAFASLRAFLKENRAVSPVRRSPQSRLEISSESPSLRIVTAAFSSVR